LALPPDEVAAIVRGQIADIVTGAIFLFIGLATCAIAAMRHRRSVRIFFWLGIWSAMYGAVQLSDLPAVLAVAPGWFRISAPYLNAAMTYLLVVPASLSFLELSQGRLRSLLQIAASLGLAIAVSGIVVFLVTGSPTRLMPYNNLLAACVLPVLVIVAATPHLSDRYLSLGQNSRVLAVGTIAFAVEALYNSLSRPLGLDPPHLLDHVGFGILLFSFGYVAVQLVVANERRLVAVDNELEVARRIQLAILPSGVPEVANLRISTAYRPMTAVAGDFYDFLSADRKQVGILVADVAGHGVPAALIASMIKVALQSVSTCAHDPGAVLRGLNRILSGQAGSQFVSAAYLWFDMESRTARYSAAGHPPLLRWTQATLERIESNGFLFGMVQEADYPVVTMSIGAGERFLLYTDGVTDAENGRGESFGDSRLEDVVRASRRRTAAELSEELLSELARWRPASTLQQDDLTFVVIDVVEPADVSE
jgi:sigma-B regulation protein RsbU (phosphoserine phosphatase)